MIRMRRRVLLHALVAGGLLVAPQFHAASGASDNAWGVREARVVATADAYPYTVNLVASAVQNLSNGRTDVSCTATVQSTTVAQTFADCYAVTTSGKATQVPYLSAFGNTGVSQGTLGLSTTTSYKICIRGLVYTGFVHPTEWVCSPLD